MNLNGKTFPMCALTLDASVLRCVRVVIEVAPCARVTNRVHQYGQEN